MPTVFYQGKYRFFFYSNEFQAEGLLEPIHVHIESGEKTAKCWLEPEISFASNEGFRSKELTEIKNIVEDRQEEIIKMCIPLFDHFLLPIFNNYEFCIIN